MARGYAQNAMTTHRDTKLLPYTPEQLYTLVADIERYPEFLPWCQALRIRNRDMNKGHEVIDADMVIAFKMFRERFGSRVKLTPATQEIDVSYIDGPFKYLTNQWRFHEAEGGTNVEFFVDFEFKSRLLQSTIGVVFGEAMRRIVTAFETRAQDLYGSPDLNA